MSGIGEKGVQSTVSLPAGSSAVSSGTTVDGVACHSSHSLIVVAGTGVTGGVVTLQVSPDGVNWVTPSGFTAITLTAAGTTVSAVTGVPAQFVRAAITTAIAGGTVTAYVGSA